MNMMSAAFQAFLVVFGFILAFGANEWREGEANKAEARIALNGILEELDANRDAVSAARLYHGEKLGTISEAFDRGEAPPLSAFDRGFVAPAQVSDAAWRSAGEVGALAHLPYDQVLALGRVYAQQQAYSAQQAVVSEIVYRQIFEAGVESIVANPRGLRSLISAFHYREEQLAASYGNALTRNGRPAS